MIHAREILSEKWRTPENYGSVWWSVPDKMMLYTEEHLKSWNSREILKMHFYLTGRLDGYGHETADDSIKHNCELFREVLRKRGIDGVHNCLMNERFYDWGYRTWQWTASPLKEKVLA